MVHSVEANRLLLDGAVALAEVECAGICIDVGYLDDAIARTRKRIERKKQEIFKTKLWKVWKRRFGESANLGSQQQLAVVLFQEMGYQPVKMTAKENISTDEEALSAIDDPFIGLYLEVKKLTKVLTTNLTGIRREVVNGKIHCFYNLHNVISFRSSSDSINFQNIPHRDSESATLVRQTFVPRPGNRLVEIDYKGAEVRISACYHHDPTMIDYINDPTKDMHRDMAVECFMLPKEKVTGAIRSAVKGQFVFAQFYGDWYIDCARNLWKSAQALGLTGHLASKGITGLGKLDPKQRPENGTFEAHIHEVEKKFWKERFAVYDQWKTDWYQEYRRRGWFRTLTGFVCQGYMRKNEVINYPVQGTAFHCLLWSLIQLQKRLRKQRSGTVIVGQIHDSLVADVPENEVADYVAMCRQIMTIDIRRHWDWIIVPMEIEAGASVGSWAEMKEVKA